MVFGFGKKKQRTVDFTKLPDVRIQKRMDFKTSGDVVDLREEQVNESPTSGTNSGSTLDFLNTMATSASDTSTNVVTQISEMSELKNKMRDMTGRIEDTSNEIYRLMQKIEFLEKKIERFESGRY